MRYRPAIIAFALSGAFLALSLRSVNPGEVREAMLHAEYGWVLAAAAVASAVISVRVLRWWLLLSASTPVSPAPLLSANTIALMVNAILPFRGVSTLLRSYLVRRRTGVPMVTSIGSITVERFCEVVSQVVTIAIVLMVIDLPGWTMTGGAVLLLVNILMIAVLTGLRVFPEPTTRLVQRVAGRFSKRAAAASVVHLESFRRGLAALGRPARLAGVMLCTAGIAAGQGFAVWLAMRAFAIDVEPLAAWALYIGVTFGLALPSAPAGVGTFQFVVISILGGLAVPASLALTASFVIQLALLGPAILLGLIFLSVEGMSLGSVAGRSRVRRAFEEPAGAGTATAPRA